MVIEIKDLRIILKELNNYKLNSFNLEFIKGLHLGFKGGIELKKKWLLIEK